ncbi:MAG TPA: hypothetical protein VGX25_30205 [Actinophytocola sp.]|nr:hypothetical protein [Actinophytocola sp.]HEV2783681.1 hypothetical protein [Actinophytocola sp.]
MTIAVGIFDLFGYTIPGSLYLALLSYAAIRLDWLAPSTITQTPALVAAIIVLLLSYLLGYLTYPLGRLANRVVPSRLDRRPREEFVRRNPAARDRDFVQADPFLLLSGVQLHDKDVATEVIRLRAAGLMLRNAAPPLGLGFLAAVLEIVLGGRPVLAATCATLLALGFFSLVIQGRRFGYWASLKTLELSFWLPDVDDKFHA